MDRCGVTPYCFAKSPSLIAKPKRPLRESVNKRGFPAATSPKALYKCKRQLGCALREANTLARFVTQFSEIVAADVPYGSSMAMASPVMPRSSSLAAPTN